MERQNIIFLDVDGPMIPESLYDIDMYCSAKRSTISTVALGWVLRLARIANAKIVMNTAHNIWGDVKTDLIRLGIPEELFHEDHKTKFPKKKSEAKGDFYGRKEAILEWIDRQPVEIDWVGFDDENYEHKNLVLCTFEDGITSFEYEKALEIFGVKDDVLLLPKYERRDIVELVKVAEGLNK